MLVVTLSLVQKGQTSGCITEWMQWNSGCSMRWMQWNSNFWWWGQCLWCKKVKLPLHTVSTGLTFFVSKTMSPSHHILLFHCILHPLCTASTASTSLTFLHQRQCPHNHIPLFHCVLHPVHTVSTAYCVHCVLHPLHALHGLRS